MRIATFILVLFCCISCTKKYMSYDNFLAELKKENINKTPIDLLYVGSMQNKDCFLLKNKKVIVENGDYLSQVAPFVHESDKFDFISWNTERRLRLRPALMKKNGSADISYASLDNRNVFVIDRDMHHLRRDGDSNLRSLFSYEPDFYVSETK